MYRSRKTTKAYNPKASKKRYESQKSACPFCRLDDRKVHKDSPSLRVMDNLHPYEFWDKYDVIDHLLLVPKRHVESLNELTNEEKVEIMNTMAEYESAGYSVYWRSKNNGTRTVPHQHTHLIKVGTTSSRLTVYSEKPYFLWKI